MLKTFLEKHIKNIVRFEGIWAIVVALCYLTLFFAYEPLFTHIKYTSHYEGFSWVGAICAFFAVLAAAFFILFPLFFVQFFILKYFDSEKKWRRKSLWLGIVSLLSIIPLFISLFFYSWHSVSPHVSAYGYAPQSDLTFLEKAKLSKELEIVNKDSAYFYKSGFLTGTDDKFAITISRSTTRNDKQNVSLYQFIDDKWEERDRRELEILMDLTLVTDCNFDGLPDLCLLKTFEEDEGRDYQAEIVLIDWDMLRLHRTPFLSEAYRLRINQDSTLSGDLYSPIRGTSDTTMRTVKYRWLGNNLIGIGV